MLLVLVGIGIVAFFVINIYTRKGQTEEVPKVTGMNIEKAIELLEEHDLEYLIVDSVFDDKAPRHHVMEQNPAAMNMVKKGRKIYLTVNSLDVPEVEMPDIAGKMSFEQAKKTLEGKGLFVGNITKQPDPSISSAADMPVFEQIYKGEPISPGTKVKRGSKIDLVVGVMENQTDTTAIPLDTMGLPEAPPDPNAGIDY
ncbi:MAG: PASTA domain-containing protein [Bacteroidia bacterium]